MSYVEKNLLPNEILKYRSYLHWSIYLPAIALILLGIIPLYLFWKNNQLNVGLTVFGLFVIAAILYWIPAWINVASSEFAVTDKRVIIKTGFVRRHTVELLLRQVEGIDVDQGILGRILGYGSITVSGTGGTRESFRRISNPLEFRRQVQMHS